MLGYIPGKLCDLDFLCKFALEAPKQDLALRGFKTVHDVRDRALEVVVGEVNEIAMHKLLVGQAMVSVWYDYICRRMPLQPGLAVVGARLVERQIHGEITVGRIRELGNIQVLKVLLRFVARRGAETLVILNGPPCARRHLPLVVLVLGVECAIFFALRRLDDRRRHVGEEPGNLHEVVPQFVEEVYQ